MKPQFFFLKAWNSSTSKNTPTPQYAPNGKKVAKAMLVPGGMCKGKGRPQRDEVKGAFQVIVVTFCDWYRHVTAMVFLLPFLVQGLFIYLFQFLKLANKVIGLVRAFPLHICHFMCPYSSPFPTTFLFISLVAGPSLKKSPFCFHVHGSHCPPPPPSLRTLSPWSAFKAYKHKHISI